MSGIKKIDIHTHVCPFPEYYPGRKDGGTFCSAAEMIKIYDEINVEKGVILPLSSSDAMASPMTSEGAKFIADQYPDRFLWFCGIDPRAMGNSSTTDLSKLFEHYKALGAKGLGEVTAPFYADDPMIDNLFAAAAHYDMPVIIHIYTKFGGSYGIVDELGLPRIEKMLKKHPSLKLIGHSSPFWSEISADNNDNVRNGYPKGKVTEGRISYLMRECENLYCDMSAGSGANALMRDPEFTAGFFEEFQDRILYGCDITSTACAHQYALDKFLDGMLADCTLKLDVYKKIVRDNAVKLLGL